MQFGHHPFQVHCSLVDLELSKRLEFYSLHDSPMFSFFSPSSVRMLGDGRAMLAHRNHGRYCRVMTENAFASFPCITV